MNNDVWVLVECREDGSAMETGLELLTPGRTLADAWGGELTAVILGRGVDNAAEAAARRGADVVLTVEGEAYARYATLPYTAALTALVETHRPGGLLLGATADGRDLAPRLACRLRTALVSECVALEPDEERHAIRWTKAIYGGRLLTTLRCPDSRLQLGTVAPGSYRKPPLGESHARRLRETVPPPADAGGVRLLEVLSRHNPAAASLTEAEIIVAGGLGLGRAEGFRLVEDLAKVLGGTVGASRGAVDRGWISKDHQVGQTGKIVTPKLYVACGISGAIQHLAGMRNAGYIVAINQNPYAPIFQVADVGVSGDLHELLPALTEQLRKRRS